MEKNEVSLHQVNVFLFVSQSKVWVTSREIANGAGVADRTARHHAKMLSDLGLFDLAEVFPAHRYKLSDKAAARNKQYLQRLSRAAEVLGIV